MDLRLRRSVRYALSLLAVLLLLCAAALVFNAELRSFVHYKVAPQGARNANFLRLGRGPLKVYLLGTIHGDHLQTRDYALAHLAAVILHLKPDMLLVEARPEELAKGHLGDGPIEMPYALLTAREAKIPIGGIDWWQLEAGRIRRTDQRRDDQMFGLLKGSLPPRGNVLVLVGFSHVAELASRLEASGFSRDSFSDQEKNALFATISQPRPFPPGMAAAIRQRIQDAKAAAKRAPELADRYLRVAASRERFLKRIVEQGERPASGAR